MTCIIMMLIITENTGNTSKVILITEKNRNDIAKKRFINLQKKRKKKSVKVLKMGRWWASDFHESDILWQRIQFHQANGNSLNNIPSCCLLFKSAYSCMKELPHFLTGRERIVEAPASHLGWLTRLVYIYFLGVFYSKISPWLRWLSYSVNNFNKNSRHAEIPLWRSIMQIRILQEGMYTFRPL